TRHNIGFRVLDAVSKASNAVFSTQRYGDVAHLRVKNKILVLLKPSTYMNLSGNAVAYWMQKENIPIENVFVIVDDLSLPVGAIRIRPKGSDAGHNGLKNIALMLKTENYTRLKFGIGNDFPRGMQVEYVLGTFSDEDNKIIEEKIPTAVEAIKAFCLSGLAFAMNHYSNK
ncbi:MAG: aminoacyl-tRNA hydrolase, partial [Bacteroidales bacterium]|nr:aminoacyl-tRNA hydrolase [Bacteroidales bacterium]